MTSQVRPSACLLGKKAAALANFRRVRASWAARAAARAPASAASLKRGSPLCESPSKRRRPAPFVLRAGESWVPLHPITGRPLPGVLLAELGLRLVPDVVKPGAGDGKGDAECAMSV